MPASKGKRQFHVRQVITDIASLGSISQELGLVYESKSPDFEFYPEYFIDSILKYKKEEVRERSERQKEYYNYVIAAAFADYISSVMPVSGSKPDLIPTNGPGQSVSVRKKNVKNLISKARLLEKVLEEFKKDPKTDQNKQSIFHSVVAFKKAYLKLDTESKNALYVALGEPRDVRFFTHGFDMSSINKSIPDVQKRILRLKKIKSKDLFGSPEKPTAISRQNNEYNIYLVELIGNLRPIWHKLTGRTSRLGLYGGDTPKNYFADWVGEVLTNLNCPLIQVSNLRLRDVTLSTVSRITEQLDEKKRENKST